MPGMKERNNDVKYIEDGTRQRKTTVTAKQPKTFLATVIQEPNKVASLFTSKVSAVSGNGWKCEKHRRRPCLSQVWMVLIILCRA